MRTIRELLLSGENVIPRFEAELLLAHALKQDRVFVIAHPEERVSEKLGKRFISFVDRRKIREPVALIVEKKEFYGREFFVNRHTLVPRPETELLVEKSLERIFASKKHSEKKFLIIDIGTGSGNIIITIAKELERKKISPKNFSFVAADISKDALVVAKKNARRHATKKSIRFFASNLLKNIPERFLRNIEEAILVANLPYLSTKEYESAPPDVKNFEPHSALESGVDGLDHYRKLLGEIHGQFPTIPTAIFLEISDSQKSALESLVSDIFPDARLSFFRDLARRWRLARLCIE